MKPGRVILPAVLVVMITVGFIQPVAANGPVLSVLPSPIHVMVSTQFRVDIWVINIPNGDLLKYLEIWVGWDTSQIELAKEPIFYHEGRGWAGSFWLNPELSLIIYDAGGPSWTSDAVWLTLIFHCKSEGTTTISLRGEYDTEDSVGYMPNVYVYVTQYSRVRSVGGIVMPINKLFIFAPYLTVIGFIASILTTAFLVKRRCKA